MKHFLIIITFLLSITFYGQTKTQQQIIEKTKAKQLEIIDKERINARIKKYDALIELNPKNDTAYYKRAKAKVDLIKYTLHPYPDTILIKDIINDYTKVITLKSKYIAEAYYGRANTKSVCSIKDNYIEDLENAVAINPKYAQAWYDMGMYYYQAGGDRMAINEIDNKKSIECYTKVIEISNTLYPTQSAYSFRASGRVLLKDYKGAIEDYTKAIDFNRNDPHSYGNYARRAYLKEELKDYKGAIEDYTKTIEVQSDNKYFRPGEYLFLRGNIKLKDGDKEGACLDWKNAQESFINLKNDMGIADTISKYCK